MHPLRSMLRAAAAAALVLSAGGAQAQALRHTQSVLADEKGGALKSPDGVACRGAAAAVADTGNKRLVLYGLQNGSFTGGREVKLEQLVAPVRVQYDSKGNLFVLDGKVRKVARLDAAGAFQAFVEVKGAGAIPVAVGAFRLDSTDGLWVLDGASRRILALDAGGAVSKEVRLPKQGTFTDFTIEGGRVFAVEATTATVWSAEPNAPELQPLSKSLKEFMNFPAYVTTRGGALLIVDQYGHGLASVGMDGTFRNRQLALGWGDGLVYYPAQVCVTEGEVAIADRFNNRIQVFAAAN